MKPCDCNYTRLL